MRPKSLILLLLALGCGLVASIGISQVLEHRNREPAGEKEPILVAAKDIKVNEPLTEKNVQLEEWPKEKIAPDAVRDFKDVTGQRAGTTILAGEAIRRAKFAIDKRIEEIPRGYRVVAVPSDATSAAGNLLQPGDRVDVLLSVTSHGAVQNRIAKTILQDIRVFAVNEQWRPAEGNKSDESITAKTVSLLVTPAQAEIMVLATEMGGHLRLALRNSDDAQIASTNGTEENELMLGGDHGDRDKESTVNSMLDWLKHQTGPQIAAVAAPTEPEERFTMELLSGNEPRNFEFTRKTKEGRWSSQQNGAPTGGGIITPSGSSPAAVTTPAGGGNPPAPAL